MAVVSHYLAALMSPSSESLEELATSKALDTSQPDRILQSFMLTGENKIVRFYRPGRA